MTGQTLRQKIRFMAINHLYNNGLPFSETLAITLRKQIERVSKNKASMILIDGYQGEGKTTLMVHIIDYINKLHNLPPASLEMTHHPQISMGGLQFISNLKLCKEENLPIVGYDEAGDFNKRGFFSSFNQLMNSVFTKFRGFKIMVVVALPNFCLLDNWLYDNGVPRLGLHLKNRNIHDGDIYAYSLSQMNWIRYWYSKYPLGSKNVAYTKVHANFRGHFLNLPPEREKKLDILSTRSKLKILTEQQVREEGLVNYDHIATVTSHSIPTIRNWLSFLKIRPKVMVGRRAFFDKSVIEQIKQKEWK